LGFGIQSKTSPKIAPLNYHVARRISDRKRTIWLSVVGRVAIFRAPPVAHRVGRDFTASKRPRGVMPGEFRADILLRVLGPTN
jgi:hypothetical protein